MPQLKPPKEGTEENKKTTLTRRDALKTLAAITGAATLASLPARWQTPLVQVGALPAHAACSVIPGTATAEFINDTTGTFTYRYQNSGYDRTVTAGPGQAACLTGVPLGGQPTATYSLTGSACDQSWTSSGPVGAPSESRVYQLIITCNGTAVGDLFVE